jgi:hypothetical protein
MLSSCGLLVAKVIDCKLNTINVDSKTDCYYIIEILLKVALNTIKPNYIITSVVLWLA